MGGVCRTRCAEGRTAPAGPCHTSGDRPGASARSPTGAQQMEAVARPVPEPSRGPRRARSPAAGRAPGRGRRRRQGTRGRSPGSSGGRGRRPDARLSGRTPVRCPDVPVLRRSPVDRGRRRAGLRSPPRPLLRWGSGEREVLGGVHGRAESRSVSSKPTGSRTTTVVSGWANSPGRSASSLRARADSRSSAARSTNGRAAIARAPRRRAGPDVRRRTWRSRRGSLRRPAPAVPPAGPRPRSRETLERSRIGRGSVGAASASAWRVTSRTGVRRPGSITCGRRSRARKRA